MFGSHKESGFTLIEVLITIMVLGVGLMGAAAMQTRAIESNSFANQLTSRTMVAEQTLEGLKNIDYDDADLDDVTAADTFTTYTDPAPPAGYMVTWEVDADSPVNNVKTIRVTATPTNSDRPPVILTLIRPNRDGL
jgi:type IV pilus assembly protein PilV